MADQLTVNKSITDMRTYASVSLPGTRSVPSRIYTLQDIRKIVHL